MNHAAGIIALIGLAVGLDACLRAINASETNHGLPLVHASLTCPKLANPCATINCNRVNTKVIA